MSDAKERPARVQAAIDYLEYCDTSMSGSFWGTPPRELSRREQAAQDAALGVLISYFHGELDYGDTPPNTTHVPKRKKKKVTSEGSFDD